MITLKGYCLNRYKKAKKKYGKVDLYGEINLDLYERMGYYLSFRVNEDNVDSYVNFDPYLSSEIGKSRSLLFINALNLINNQPDMEFIDSFNHNTIRYLFSETHISGGDLKSIIMAADHIYNKENGNTYPFYAFHIKEKFLNNKAFYFIRFNKKTSKLYIAKDRDC